MPRIGSLRPAPNGGFPWSLHLVDVIVDIAFDPHVATTSDAAGPRWDVTDATGAVIGLAALDGDGGLGLITTMPLLDRKPVRCVARRAGVDHPDDTLDLIWRIADVPG